MNDKWLLDFSGCDGGSIGSPENQSIWVCGIEWGGGDSAESLKTYIHQKWEASPDFGYEKLEYYPYNIVTYKLLAALCGKNIGEYVAFAEQEKPFLNKGCSSSNYFKLNLYPISFKNTDPNLWTSEFSEITGFQNKNEYIRWCNRYRFPKMNEWVKQYCPKLVICYGKSYETEFNIAFSDGYKSFNEEQIEHVVLKWKRNENGTVVAVLPFPNAPTGLKHNSTIQKVGERLAELIK
ncbi:hypothetical protein ACKLNO_06970 [Neisseriaceae bacterium B1]